MFSVGPSSRLRNGSDAEIRELLGVNGRAGQDLAGVIFPYTDPRNARVLGHRIRLDMPLPDGQKYLSEQGCRYLFFPPSCQDELSDISIPTVIVEAEKSALALVAFADRSIRRLLVIAVGGVWGWKRKGGLELTPVGGREPATAPSPSLDLVLWKGRKTIVAFDSNVAGRRDLENARLALADELRKRGAQVFIASIPRRQGINGPDDLIAVAGDNAAIELLDRAAIFAPSNAARTVNTRFVLTHLGDILAKPDVPVNYLLEGVLLSGGVSGVFAKPKVGKSTFVRNLCLAVARGENFLELKTKQGECIAESSRKRSQ